MRRLMAVSLAIAALSGCTPAAFLAAGGLVAAAVESYCTATSDLGKQAVRDRLSSGTPVLACQEPVK